MIPDSASDPRQAFTLDAMSDELRAGLLALADQCEAEAQAEARRSGHSALASPVPDAGAPRRDPWFGNAAFRDDLMVEV